MKTKKKTKNTTILFQTLAVVAMCGVAPAWGQQTRSAQPGPDQTMTQATPGPMQPSMGGDTRWTIGALGGVGVVQNVGGLFGLQAGVQVAPNVEIVGEGSWFQNVATRSRETDATTLATFLQQSQGATASATVSAPTWYGGAGARFTFGSGRSMRPYVLAEVGLARVTNNTTFTLGGTDITSQIGTYGITLGSDLSGSSSVAAYTVGAGLRFLRGKWFTDVDVALTSIRTIGQASNLIRAGIGFGARF